MVYNSDLKLPELLDRRPSKKIADPKDVGDQPKPDILPLTETGDIGASKLQSHSFADMFPMMRDEDFGALVVSISKDGLEEPIVIYEGKILDGRNRYAACSEAGIEPNTVEYKGDDPLEYVLRKNLHRRQLQTSQRAMVAGKMADLPQGGDHKSGDFKASNGGLKIDDVARILNVSAKTVERAKSILASGDEGLIEAVESGTKSVSAAAKQLTKSSNPVDPLPEGERQCQKLQKLWSNTGSEGRELFRKVIGATT